MSSKQILLFCLFLFANLLNGQNSLNKDSLGALKPQILVKARAQDGRVLLRWAVSEATQWQHANRVGFKVERYESYLDKNDKRKVIRKLLTPEVVKPVALDKWKEIAMKDDYAAIIAQSIYGEKFGVQNNANAQSSDISSLMALTEEVKMRHSFALLAADMNFEASCMAGWGFIDSTIKPGVEYYYRVYLANNKNAIKIDTGGAIITTHVYPVVAPLFFKGQFTSKIVNFTWDNEIQASEYTSYLIERSEDSLNFKSITDKPIINISNSEKPLPSFFYKDTMPSNDKFYYYRLRGITCFGELSAPTAVVKGIGREQLSFSPNILETSIVNDTTLVIKWEIEKDSTLKLLNSFEIGVAEQDNGNYKVVMKDIGKHERMATYTGSLSTQYFVVTAVDIHGERYNSFPQLVQAIDSIAPNPPVGLMGVIDSNNVVKLTWQPNKEEDLEGYHILRANTDDEEMSVITTEPITSNSFTDTLSSKLLNEKVYYAIVALDHRFNQSKLSDTTVVVRPDKNPPVSAVFKDYKLEETKVHLYWENSASEDIAVQRLYKKVVSNVASDNNTWDLIKEFTSLDSTSYTDHDVKQGSVVGYTLIAVDKNKNEGNPSVPLMVQIPLDKRDKAAVKELKAIADRKSKKILLEWEYAEKGVVEYQIYRTQGKQPLSLWKIAEYTTVAIVDEDISPSNIYKYAIRAVFKDGTMSRWKEVDIQF
jgi:uncharacterized protein